MPASVGSALGRGTATAQDLISGRSWEALLEGLRRAGSVLRGDGSPQTPVEQAAGYRHLLVLLALGIDEALRPSDPYDPHIEPGNVDAVLKWGMDCPDAAYVGASIRGNTSYRVRGHRGTVRYLGLQVMAGTEAAANLVADELVTSDGDQFELILSAERHPGNWMPLSERASSLVVRQFFYDWEIEEPARLTIECLDPPIEARPVRPPTAEGVARQLVALGEFLEASVTFWLDLETRGRAAGINRFREPAARTDMGGAAENVTVWGSWELDADEALVIEVTPPESLYWSVALGNFWWETIDYANHQSSLNGHQAVVDADGVFRAVVAGRDPGVANWLDTAGFRQGPMIFRWVRAAGAAPVPDVRVMPFAAVDEALPAGTARVDAATRRQTMARRRAGIRRRFPR
jgi:hypothetical protein